METHSSRRDTTGFVYSDTFLRHNASPGHPECPDRLGAIVDRLQTDGLRERMHAVEIVCASRTELERAHTPGYLDLLWQAEGRYWDPDTFIGEGSPEIASLAAGGTLAAARMIRRGELTNAFCAVRPPGHHAPADRAMGFCLLNNVAVAAADCVACAPDAKVLILDWDVHHGNGTQAIFYESPDVMYASLHQYPFYPGSGGAAETGRGPGQGLTVNHPLNAGAGNDEFLGAVSAILDGPAREFAPGMLILSAGFDAHHADPLAGLNVTTDGFAEATRMVCSWAAKVCEGKVLSVLEGGYNLESLADSAAAHVRELLEAAKNNRTGD